MNPNGKTETNVEDAENSELSHPVIQTEDDEEEQDSDSRRHRASSAEADSKTPTHSLQVNTSSTSKAADAQKTPINEKLPRRNVIQNDIDELRATIQMNIAKAIKLANDPTTIEESLRLTKLVEQQQRILQTATTWETSPMDTDEKHVGHRKRRKEEMNLETDPLSPTTSSRVG
jgi:hypothetical protein